MKPINALILALASGVATFAVQSAYFPPQAHAAAFAVPNGPDWRNKMLDNDPGSAVVQRSIGYLTSNLGLTADQATKIRPLLQQRHERILALLLTASPSLTRDQFIAKRREISAETHKQVDALLTPDQLELVRQRPAPARAV